MKTYFMKLNNREMVLTARNNVEAMKLSGTFGIKEDNGIKSLIREDGEVVI
nr:hypothetical protein [uncultured Tyzzerella sp.]